MVIISGSLEGKADPALHIAFTVYHIRRKMGTGLL